MDYHHAPEDHKRFAMLHAIMIRPRHQVDAANLCSNAFQRQKICNGPSRIIHTGTGSYGIMICRSCAICLSCSGMIGMCVMGHRLLIAQGHPQARDALDRLGQYRLLAEPAEMVGTCDQSVHGAALG